MEATGAASCNCFPEDETALRRHEEDVLGLTSAEREELWEAVGILRAGVDKVLQPDWWNYMFLGNAIRHVHLHLIPRYASARTIRGWEFADRHWGQLHARQERPSDDVSAWVLAELKKAVGKRGS